MLVEAYQYSKEIECSLSIFNSKGSSKSSLQELSVFNTSLSVSLKFDLFVAKFSNKSIIIAKFYENIRITGNAKALKGFHSLLNSILSQKDSGLLNSFLKLEKAFFPHKEKILFIFEAAAEIEKLAKKLMNVWVKKLFKTLDLYGLNQAQKFTQVSLDLLQLELNTQKKLFEKFLSLWLKDNSLNPKLLKSLFQI